MKLIFIHGWGFDTEFWDRLAPLLSEFEQQRIDLGFFGKKTDAIQADGNILIGHSLGFVHGMRNSKNWAGWIAINSFPHFTNNDNKTGCVEPAVLRTMRQQLAKNPERTLTAFYELIGASQMVAASSDLDNLSAGLDELRDADIGDILQANTKPGIVLAAKNDPLVPTRTSEAMTVSNKMLQWHPTGGHILPQSGAAWCAKAIKNFIEANKEGFS
jgi:pimeloyl-[acyl-carrier protein] methyl ester esterase